LTIWGIISIDSNLTNYNSNQEGYEPVVFGRDYRVNFMGMSDVLQHIKNAEESAKETLADAKEKATKIVADARKEAAEILQNAQDGAVSSTVATIDSAKQEAGKEAAGVQAEGAKAVESIHTSAGDRRDAAVQLIIDSLMSN